MPWMPGKKVAMVQSNYIPWKGYFDIINTAELFVFYDDTQFTKEDWRNRNKIKTPGGVKWLTVPCGSKTDRLICDVRLESSYWQRKHWDVIRHSYARAAHFKEYAPLLEEMYLGRTWNTLVELNHAFITRICREVLGIDTEFADSRDYDLPSGASREERWLTLLHRIGTREFVIGPTARNYLDDERQAEIERGGIRLLWMDYSGYPEYRQLHPPFEHHVSIIDLILNEGPHAVDFMKSFRQSRTGGAGGTTSEQPSGRQQHG